MDDNVSDNVEKASRLVCHPFVVEGMYSWGVLSAIEIKIKRGKFGRTFTTHYYIFFLAINTFDYCLNMRYFCLVFRKECNNIISVSSQHLVN